VALVAVGVAACGNDTTANGGSAVSTTTGNPTAGLSVAVNQKDFAISLDRPTVASGQIAFVIHNAGPSPHELKVFRTDLPEDKLPTTATATVNETGPGVTRVAATPATTDPGGTQRLTATLAPGRYVLVCNIPGHYGLGMHTVLVVS
jgi:uncharacterized cupredoxin-like copper-binding protein